MERRGFYKYAAHILGTQYTEIGEPELKNKGEKYKYKNDLIIHNSITNSIWNQSTDMIQGFLPLLCIKNRVIRIRPVWDPHANIDHSQKSSKVPRGPVEATNKNSGNKYHNRVKWKNTGPSKRARALLGLMPRFWVRYLEWVKGTNYCYIFQDS